MLLITTLEVTNSTNSYLHDLIEKKKNCTADSIIIDVPEFYTVSCNFQTDGKGQSKNTWHSEPGKNLLLSTLIYPLETAELQFRVNMKVCIGILEFCKKYISNEGFSIKWPNDIYFHDKKIGGVLIEHTITGNSILYSIIGIGLNINQLSFPNQIPNPISAAQICNHNFNLDECIRELLFHISEQKTYYKKHSKILKKEYLSNLYKFKEWGMFEINGDVKKACIEDVNKYGMLCLIDEQNKTYECGIKEVKYIL